MDAQQKETALAANNYQFGIDTNQRRTFDRLLARILQENPDLQITEAALLAGEEVQSLVPTAREAAQRIAEMRSGPTYCYLAFHGLGDRAAFLKVGMSAHPEQRLYGAATDNPLDRLWTFLARFPVRAKAYGAEQALLRHLRGHKRKGEWLDVENTDATGASRMAAQLSEVIGATFFPLVAANGR
jgi:hypothetical protein